MTGVLAATTLLGLPGARHRHAAWSAPAPSPGDQVRTLTHEQALLKQAALAAEAFGTSTDSMIGYVRDQEKVVDRYEAVTAAAGDACSKSLIFNIPHCYRDRRGLVPRHCACQEGPRVMRTGRPREDRTSDQGA